VPEETALLAAGWWAHHAGASILAVTGCAWAAILIGDLGTFALGRGLLHGLVGATRLGRLFPAERRRWAEEQVSRHGWRAILLARFLVGLRGFLYFALGGSRYSFRRFFAIDAAIATVEVALVVGVGYVVGASRQAQARVEVIDVFAIVALVVGSLALPWIVRRVSS
jgi:membrane protein DedA with SNARE-associated domain